ncbi:GNAT family N-acetyltransferase [Ferroplasma acidiphilum]|uniref:GNAT family N-acetyltransferase n=1 Tax=Ferroplasma acidiphilum TaxID=74969 RepID=UPI002816457D|nr:GNAT family N-acetyltransferase [Ferroplasma acidiphilum]WMT53152.1 MAG: GNAT family N-acetyltransferase [Ferroplasma acidiphilum]
MPIIIRKLAEGDEESVKEVATASWNFAYAGIYSDEYIKQWLEDHYSLESIIKDIKKSLNNEELLFLGAFLDSQCAGFIELKFSHGEADLLRLYLLPEKIWLGYGKSLLKEAEDFFLKKSIKRCKLEVNCKNFRAISFYKNSGFKITGIDIDDYKMVKEY